jgi:hypothetical protein
VALYRIVLCSDIEDYEESDNPSAAKADLDRFSLEFPANHYLILRNGKEITQTELEDDVDLQGDFAKTSKVPAGFRRGTWGRTHDLGISPEDNPTSVWKPPNPEDEYK